MTEPATNLRHAEFQHSGFTWRIVFERYTIPVPNRRKAAYALLTEPEKQADIARRRRCDYALRVMHKGTWRACALGSFARGVCGEPDDDVFRDDIGDLDLRPVLKHAASLEKTATPTEIYSGASDCKRAGTGKRCDHCEAFAELQRLAKLVQAAKRKRSRNKRADEDGDEE